MSTPAWGMLVPDDADGDLLGETKAAIRAGGLIESDRGLVAATLRLADLIDQIDDLGLNPAGKLDNVSLPTYLKYMGALGLTPHARAAAARPAQAKAGGAGGSVTAARGRVRARRGV